jgi:hypothetical protein
MTTLLTILLFSLALFLLIHTIAVYAALVDRKLAIPWHSFLVSSALFALLIWGGLTVGGLI